MGGRTNYPNLRQHLNADFAELSDPRIESLLRSRNMDAEAMEGFFDESGKFALKAAPSASIH